MSVLNNAFNPICVSSEHKEQKISSLCGLEKLVLKGKIDGSKSIGRQKEVLR